ncbi:MAG: hypothetical protein ABI609_03660 [Acidobacteriota bacterium]
MIESEVRDPEYDDAYVLEHCYTPEGVDRSLILVALAMTVDERLERLRVFGAGILELRGAYASTQRG